MIEMSFYDGTLDREKAVKVIEETGNGFIYTYGLSYRKPTTYRVPITKERAIEIVNTQSLLDITEEETVFHLNAYSGDDMW